MRGPAFDVMSLLREDLHGFAGYRSARSEVATGAVWLNANEAAYPNAADEGGDLRRYPEPQPEALRGMLCGLYGVPAARLLIGRGSDELIDLLVRVFCRMGRDAVLVTPPVFGMYGVCARLQGVPLLEVPLDDDEQDFCLDLERVALCAERGAARLVFLCSPGNPAGGTLPAQDVLALARRLRGRALVVVDEAYIEFADARSLVAPGIAAPNLVVLRTLSKAHALAGARIGCAIAHPAVIAALRCCQAPYPVPVPCAERALGALTGAALAATRLRVQQARIERARLAARLGALPGVRRVYPSQGNFLLVRFVDAEAAFADLLAAGVVVRDMRAMPQLADALRITLGTPEQNDAVVAALGARVVAA